jgi:gamma-glutamyltranspeptidase/glutathione hydrolase
MIVTVAAFPLAAAAAAPATQPTMRPLNVVVITGGHGFDVKAFPKLFEGYPDLKVTHVALKAHTEIFDEIKDWPYDAIVFYNMTQIFPEDRQKNFLALLDRGVGVVSLHHNIWAYQDWAEFAHIIGGKQFAKESQFEGKTYPQSTYQHGVDIPCHVEDATHPVTAGLPPDFTLQDETYHGLWLDPDVKVLLTTSAPTADRALAWCRNYRAARTVCIQLGHGPGIFTEPNYRRFVYQAILWAGQRREPVQAHLPGASPLPPFAATGKRGVIATVHPLASEAGAAAFARGGNAIDAAIAAALTLGVVDGHNSGIGGGCFVLVRRADGSMLAIDGREVAPVAASRDMFLDRQGKLIPGASTTGALAIGVPGALAAYDRAVRDGGRLSLNELILPAADIAERGWAIDEHYARRIASVARDLGRFPASAAIFLDSDGKPWPAGHTLRQTDLAATHRAIAKHGINWFYSGPFAQRTAQWMRENGGLMTAKDFADYRVRIREPLVTTYRAYTIVGFPPPSSGGVHVAQILNTLENFDLRSLDRDGQAQRLHVMAEAMKLAFADRAYWLGDPAFAKVPRGLVSKDYAKQLAGRIDLRHTIDIPTHGVPHAADSDVFEPTGGKHTTHIAASDAEGNWVAITTTVNTTFGSKVVIPGTGVVMNDQMDDFAAQPGAPNAFGLVGTDANAVAPGKRPLSSMSPTIVLGPDGKPILALGAAGGPTIITQVVQVLVNRLDLGMGLAEAVAAPRIHHQWQPDQLAVEKGLDAKLVESLKAMGHPIVVRDSIGVSQEVGKLDDGSLLAVHDPRVPGKAVGMDGTP